MYRVLALVITSMLLAGCGGNSTDAEPARGGSMATATAMSASAPRSMPDTSPTRTTRPTASPTPATPEPPPAGTATPGLLPAATPEPTRTATATPGPTSVATPAPTTPGEQLVPAASQPSPTNEAAATTFDAPPGVYTAITVGAVHACALTADGEAVCWDIASGTVWDALPGPYTAITARRGATCAITEAGEIVCWSAGGGPFPEDEPDPSRDAPPGRYTAFSWDVKYALDRYTYACAVTDGSEVVCWSLEGSPMYSEELILPDPPPGSYTAISVRYAFLGWAINHLTVCALAGTDGAVCWRAGSAHSSVFPPSTWFLKGHYASVAVSGRSSCALTITG